MEALIPQANANLTQADIVALIDNQVSFVARHLYNEAYPHNVMKREVVKKSDWTSYPWGK